MESSYTIDAQTRAQEHLTKALNFQRMGMMTSAEHELTLAQQLYPAIVTDPHYQVFHAQITEQQTQAEAWKLPMRVGAGLLIADTLVIVLLWLINLAGGNFGEFLLWGLVHIGVDIYLAVTLLQFKDTGRRATIWWAVLGLLLGALNAFASNSWLDLLIQVSFSGSLLILLLGKPSKIRAGLAVGIFALGYLGTFCSVFALSVMTEYR